MAAGDCCAVALMGGRRGLRGDAGHAILPRTDPECTNDERGGPVSVLLVDIGNSRIKWARLESGRLGLGRAASYLDWGTTDYRRRLFGRARGVELVLVSSVAGPKANRLLTAAGPPAGGRGEVVAVPP